VKGALINDVDFAEVPTVHDTMACISDGIVTGNAGEVRVGDELVEQEFEGRVGVGDVFGDVVVLVCGMRVNCIL